MNLYIHFHKYGHWKDQGLVNVYEGKDNGGRVNMFKATIVFMERRCDTCGFLEVKHTRSREMKRANLISWPFVKKPKPKSHGHNIGAC